MLVYTAGIFPRNLAIVRGCQERVPPRAVDLKRRIGKNIVVKTEVRGSMIIKVVHWM